MWRWLTETALRVLDTNQKGTNRKAKRQLGAHGVVQEPEQQRQGLHTFLANDITDIASRQNQAKQTLKKLRYLPPKTKSDGLPRILIRALFFLTSFVLRRYLNCSDIHCINSTAPLFMMHVYDLTSAFLLYWLIVESTHSQT